MAETKELKSNEIVYTIPLREAFKKSEKKRTPYAARLIREYLKRHTKAAEIKIGKKLNEKVWERGIRKPPRRVRVKVLKEGSVAKAEILGFEYEEFKAKPKTEKKGMKEKLLGRLGPKAMKKQEEENIAEGEKKPEAAGKAEKHEMDKD